MPTDANAAPVLRAKSDDAVRYEVDSECSLT